MRLFLILISALSIGQAYSQIASNTESSDSTNIYTQSMILYCDYLDSLDVTSRVLFVEENSMVTKGLPSTIGDFEIKLVQIHELRKLVKNENGIQLIRIVPLRIKEGQFFVNIIPFSVTYKKKNFNFINGGGEKVIYRYDSKSETFVFEKIHHGRI